MLEITQRLIEDPRKSRRRTQEIKYIVIHYPACPGHNALWLADYFARTKRTVSTHYIVDNDDIIQVISTDRVAYHAAARRAADYRCDARNGNSIGIDICDDKLDRGHISADDDDWFFGGHALALAASLCARLCQIYNLPEEAVIRHYDVTGKRCPAPFIGDKTLRAIMIGGRYITGDEYWAYYRELVHRALHTTAAEDI